MRKNLNKVLCSFFKIHRLEGLAHFLHDPATLCNFLLKIGNHCKWISVIIMEEETFPSLLSSESHSFRSSKYSVRLSRSPKKLINWKYNFLDDYLKIIWLTCSSSSRSPVESWTISVLAAFANLITRSTFFFCSIFFIFDQFYICSWRAKINLQSSYDLMISQSTLTIIINSYHFTSFIFVPCCPVFR